MGCAVTSFNEAELLVSKPAGQRPGCVLILICAALDSQIGSHWPVFRVRIGAHVELHFGPALYACHRFNRQPFPMKENILSVRGLNEAVFGRRVCANQPRYDAGPFDCGVRRRYWWYDICGS